MTERRLYLLRHAKAVPATAAGGDFERPLAPTGWTAMDEIGRIVTDEGYRPGRILCSTARRTRDTLAALLGHLAADTEIILSRALYEADDGALLAQIAETSDDVAELMVIGHNPTIEQVAHALSGDGAADAVSRLSLGMPTAGLAVLSFANLGWSAIRPRSGRLIAFHAPTAPD